MLLVTAAMLYPILTSRKPLLAIYRDGIQVRKGRHELFSHWQDFKGVMLVGMTGPRALTLHGLFLDTRSNRGFSEVTFPQDHFIDPLGTVKASVDYYQENTALRGQLPPRPSTRFPVALEPR